MDFGLQEVWKIRKRLGWVTEVKEIESRTF